MKEKKGVAGGKWESNSTKIYYNGGNVGIGTTNPGQRFSVMDGNIGVFSSTNDTMGLFASSYGNYLHIGCWNEQGSQSKNIVLNQYGGRVGIGYNNPSYTLHVNGDFGFKNWRLYQETGSDALIFFKAGGRGYLAANGSHVMLNFTGQHRTFVENVLHTDASNNKGLIVCANKNTYVGMNEQIHKGNKAITQNESLPLVSLCTKSKDKSCYGVISQAEDPNERSDRFGNFVTPYEKEEGDTRIFINSLGEGAIWVSNKNGPLESGDYITTSDIPGYGEKQDSEFLANYTVAKITMDCDFNPQLQPKEVILKEAALDGSGNTVYNNVLDANGEIQWVPQLDSLGNVIQEYPYNIRYLDKQGNLLTKQQYDNKLPNESVYIAAYVGCTYHCG